MRFSYPWRKAFDPSLIKYFTKIKKTNGNFLGIKTFLWTPELKFDDLAVWVLLKVRWNFFQSQKPSTQTPNIISILSFLLKNFPQSFSIEN